MCIIIDNNVVARVLFDANDAQFGQLHASIVLGAYPPVVMVYGGGLKREYLRNSRVRRALVLLDRAGRARQEPDATVDNEELVLRHTSLLASDDPHILALARVARLRLLCSLDQALQQDFRNKRLIDAPRGRIYTRASHRKLLIEMCSE